MGSAINLSLAAAGSFGIGLMPLGVWLVYALGYRGKSSFVQPSSFFWRVLMQFGSEGILALTASGILKGLSAVWLGQSAAGAPGAILAGLLATGGAALCERRKTGEGSLFATAMGAIAWLAWPVWQCAIALLISLLVVTRRSGLSLRATAAVLPFLFQYYGYGVAGLLEGIGFSSLLLIGYGIRPGKRA